MTRENLTIALSMPELREIRFEPWPAPRRHCNLRALLCGRSAATDSLGEMRRFAAGGTRNEALRMPAPAANGASNAAHGMEGEAASYAARAAGHAAASAYLHPLAKQQIIHILGSAVHAAWANELDAGEDRTVGAGYIETAIGLASPGVVRVLKRYPNAPSGGNRIGELLRELDASLRRCLPTSSNRESRRGVTGPMSSGRKNGLIS